MQSMHIANRQLMVETWSEMVQRLVKEINESSGFRGAVWEHSRDKLRMYGTMLAHTRGLLEADLDAPNPSRDKAFDAYASAFQREIDLREECSSGAFIGWPKGTLPSKTWQEQLEEAERTTDHALLGWCSEKP